MIQVKIDELKNAYLGEYGDGIKPSEQKCEGQSTEQHMYTSTYIYIHKNIVTHVEWLIYSTHSPIKSYFRVRLKIVHVFFRNSNKKISSPKGQWKSFAILNLKNLHLY